MGTKKATKTKAEPAGDEYGGEPTEKTTRTRTPDPHMEAGKALGRANKAVAELLIRKKHRTAQLEEIEADLKAAQRDAAAAKQAMAAMLAETPAEA